MWPIIDLVIPRRCLGCTRRCRDVLCTVCGEQLVPDGVAYRMEQDEGIVTWSPYRYVDPLSRAIKRVKTNGLAEGSKGLATLLDPHLPTGPTTWVPASARTRRRRGVDLPEVLSGPNRVRLLELTDHGKDAGRATAKERRRQDHRRFRVVTAVPRRVTLIDDVRATGATALAAATALRLAGAERVFVVALAASNGAPSAVTFVDYDAR